MKSLITGATGFMGARLCKALSERGDEIHALVLPGEDYSHISRFIAEAREGDITNPLSLVGVADGVDVVYHLAARVVDNGSYDDFYKPILDGTRNMLEACADRAGRFVYVSSICACGTGRHMKGLTESDECQKTGVYYGDAKLEAEMLVKSHAADFPKGFVIARPDTVIGPRSVWVNELGKMIRDSIFTYFDGGRYSAGLIYIDDLVDGLVLCGVKDQAAGQTYFFGSGWEVSWKQYLDDLAVLFGKKIRFSLPFKFAWALGYVSEKISQPLGIRPMITRHAVGLLGRDLDVDCSKAKCELGWKTRVSYDDAMKEIKLWVKENMT